jgi:YVTN family beta-propeller protein
VVSAADYAYVANYTSGTVSVVSAATEKVVATVTVALGVTSETLSSNGSYLFVGTSSGALYLVNTSTNTVVTGTGLPAQAGTAAINYLTTGANGYVYAEGSGAAYAINQSTYAVTAITVGSTGDQIRGAVVTSNGSTLYVSDYTAGTVYPVNTGTDTVGTAITVGTQPIGLALSSTGATLYVANGGSANITPVTTSSNTAGTAIPVAGSAPQYLAVTASYIYVSSNTNNLYEVSIASSSLVQVRTTASTSAINDIALNGSGTFLYWSHSTTNTLTIISTAVPTTATTTLAANLQPAGSAMSPNGNYVWVSSGGGSATEISVISVATNAVVGTIPVVYNPTSLVFNPAGTDVWVAASYFDEVQEFAVNATQSGVTSTSPVQNISTGQTDMNGITISPSGQYVYTAAWGSNNIVEISTSTNAVVATLTVGSEPNYMAVTNSGSQVWVTNWAAGTISVVTVGSGGALSILTTLTVGSDLQGLVPSANGVSMYVAVEGASQLWVFNISTLAVTSQITVGVLPIGIGESPDGNFVFTANYSSGNISVISISANSRVATIPAGTDCSGIAVSGGLGAGSI